MSGKLPTQLRSVETQPLHSSVVTDELKRILEVLSEEFPTAAHICFSFDGTLQAHIDVRKGEEVAMIEARLPKLNSGIFTQVRHGSTPGHAFLHRITAFVSR